MQNSAMPLRFYTLKKLYTPVTSRVLLFDLQVDKGVGLGNNKAAQLYTFFLQLVIGRYHFRRPEKGLEM